LYSNGAIFLVIVGNATGTPSEGWRTKSSLHYRTPCSSIKDFRLSHKRAHLDACPKTAEAVVFFNHGGKLICLPVAQ
jgi:hypothetical protein